MKENETKKFDQKAYIKQYDKDHYKNLKVRVKPEDYEKIVIYCKDMNISQAKFVQLACLYVIDNDLFGEIVQKDWGLSRRTEAEKIGQEERPRDQESKPEGKASPRRSDPDPEQSRISDSSESTENR